MDKVNLSGAYIVRIYWSRAENTVFADIECPKCRSEIKNVDAKDHFIQCPTCKRVLRIDV